MTAGADIVVHALHLDPVAPVFEEEVDVWFAPYDGQFFIVLVEVGRVRGAVVGAATAADPPVTLPDGWVRWTSWATLVPNPEWEEMTNVVTFEDPGMMLIDHMHIATECVPEPSTFALLGTGALGLLVFAWRWRGRGNAYNRTSS